MTDEERAAVLDAVRRAEAVAGSLGIPFRKAAETVVRPGMALREETIAAMVALRDEQAAEADPRAHAEAQIDRLVPELAEAMEAWLGRDREDWRASNRAAGRLQLLMRSISGYAGDIAAFDSRDHWWGVNAKRD